LKILLLIPPFTQLNTSYPSISYIKGFLNTLNISSFQVDLSLEVILDIFSQDGLKKTFSTIEKNEPELSENAHRIFTQRKKYINTINDVMCFLQNKNPMLAHTINKGGFLPEASRFQVYENYHLEFGTLGIQDMARHLCTLYLEDLGDIITEAIDPNFGFSRYAERISRTATHFEPLAKSLKSKNSFVSQIMVKILKKHINHVKPDMVCISIPFPGNVFGAFKCGQLIKANYPEIHIVMGGGYVNTELRSIYDPNVFDYTDYITLDDGEAPLQHLIEFLQNTRPKSLLKRTFLRENGDVKYIDGSTDFDLPQRDIGTPDYTDLQLDKYISVLEVLNPMHRLWSDGRWNKLTLAHGCYWGKCSFCDITLDYIKRYEPLSAAQLCDRIETIKSQTGQNGFHFVDEAAPPALLRDLSIEIIRRNLNVVWWTNIRFEKSFTPDLCKLMSIAGCVAISGGLEVASDRLLGLMKKGVTVAQVAQVSHAFKSAGIMVHAYLMYGFPTQTLQETIDSLEMVRQMFGAGILDSGFWHQFAMTAHSPVGLDPKSFKVIQTGPYFGGFAENDYFHDDPSGADHELFSEGLKSSLHNYMQGYALDEDLQSWFDFPVPSTSVAKDYISSNINQPVLPSSSGKIILWTGGEAIELIVPEKRNKKKNGYVEVIFSGITENYSIFTTLDIAKWLITELEKISPESQQLSSLSQMAESYQNCGLGNFEEFYHSDLFRLLKSKGLLIF
jgi:radical SAM superfamily enzyme YgiQ (UPF0313 family)